MTGFSNFFEYESGMVNATIDLPNEEILIRIFRYLRLI